MANVKLSQIVSGGAFVVGTDNIVTVRNGNTDVLTTLGTAASENLSSIIIDNGAGALTIGAGQVTSAMLAGAVSPGKISLTDTHILVGNGSNIAADVAMSGDVAIADTGATTIQSNAITTSKINNAAVTYAKVQNVGASSLLGNPTGSPAAPSEITLGSGLSFSGTTLVSSGGGAVSSVSNSDGTLTISPTTGAVVASIALGHANTWTSAQTVTPTQAANTSADGLILADTTTASAGNQQYSPSLRLTGQGWKTTATAASQTVDWIVENRPVQGTTNPSANLVFSSQINAGGYSQRVGITSAGVLAFGSTFNTGIAKNAAGPLEVNNGTAGTLDNLVLAKIGVGNTAPQAPLHVGILTSEPNSSSGIFSQASTIFALDLHGTDTGNRRAAILFSSNNGSTYSKSFEIGVDANKDGTNSFYWFDDVASANRFFIDSTGNIGVNKVSSLGGQMHIQAHSLSTVGEVVQGAASQSADLAQWQNSSAVVLTSISSSGLVNKYNQVATAGLGIPAIYGSGRSTAQTAAVASVATYTVGASDASFYVSANVLVTASVTNSFTVTVAYTDEGNTARTLTLNFSQITGTFLTAITNVQGTGAYEGIPLHIRCKAATSITIATTGTFTSVTYNVEGLISQLM